MKEGFGGDRFWKFSLWIFFKKRQLFLRSHLSHLLVIVLGIFVIIREGPEIARMPGHPLSGLDWLILIITGATFVSVIWEIWGNKLSTSPQEIRFATAMRVLLAELEIFAYGKDKEPNVKKRLEDFIKSFLDLTSETLCGKKSIAAGLMLLNPNTKKLELTMASSAADYPIRLEIPLPDDENKTMTGPAGHAYQRVKIIYMPLKSWGYSFPFELSEERWEPSEPTTGWILASPPDKEKFHSVLCIPVALYHEKNKKDRYAVLNFSTKRLDPFVTRDFLMAECFASILAQALHLAKQEVGSESTETLPKTQPQPNTSPQHDGMASKTAEMHPTDLHPIPTKAIGKKKLRGGRRKFKRR